MNEWLDTNKQIGVVDYSGPSLLIDSICQHLGPSLQVICTTLLFYSNYATTVQG